MGWDNMHVSTSTLDGLWHKAKIVVFTDLVNCKVELKYVVPRSREVVMAIELQIAKR